MGERVSDTGQRVHPGREIAWGPESESSWPGRVQDCNGLLSQGEDGPPGNGTEGFPGFPVSTQSPA